MASSAAQQYSFRITTNFSTEIRVGAKQKWKPALSYSLKVVGYVTGSEFRDEGGPVIMLRSSFREDKQL